VIIDQILRHILPFRENEDPQSQDLSGRQLSSLNGVV
jgi:hypothetical protein